MNEDELIAIVAMDCKLPQVSNVEEFWQKLQSGDTAIVDLTDADIASAGIPASESRNRDYVKRAGILDDIDKFDSEYFGYSATEADVMDIQQRLMLQMAVTVLERANIDPQRFDRRIGVFAGAAISSYLFGVLNRRDLVDSLGEMIIRHGNDKDFLATRISYKLDLRGPSVAVQTACSTGLTAVHIAVNSLLMDECDAALVGAVHIRVPDQAGYHAPVGGVLAKDGVCRPFSDSASGTVFTNGLGLVLLKRLRDAEADGDDIQGIIVGSAMNNDGADKVSFTAPSVSGQASVLRQALAVCESDPDDIAYLEAHGTGTALGDPVEIEAIKQAFGITGQPCGIGSLKGNFGHANIAAGIIGLIKAVLILKHGVIPPTVNVGVVNPDLGLANSRYFIATERHSLDLSRNPLVGVSAFGMGGTNCHVMMRQAAPPRKQGNDRPNDRPSILTISAKSPDSLVRQVSAIADDLHSRPSVSLAEYAHTLRTGRARHAHRVAFAASNVTDAIRRLQSGQYYSATASINAPSAFMFAGQGTQHHQMGRSLAHTNPVFANALQSTLSLLDRALGFDLMNHLSESDGSGAVETSLAQPLIFAVEYAVAISLIEQGAKPNFVFGHSLGEIVAATIAGVFDLENAVRFVVARASMMGLCEPGAMVAVDRLDAYADLLADNTVVIAARNGEHQYVLSGAYDGVAVVESRAIEAGHFYKRLPTSHAFHSPMMAGAAGSLLEFLGSCTLNAPSIPLVSNITGAVLTEYEARNPQYWADHLIRPVDFRKSVKTLTDAGVTRFIEIGHGRTMTNMLNDNLPAEREAYVVQSLGDIDDEASSFADAVALAWVIDPEVRIDEYTSAARTTQVPTYSFEPRTHWITPTMGFASHTVRTLGSTEATDIEPAPTPALLGSSSAAEHTNVAEPVVDSATDEIYQIVCAAYEEMIGQSHLDPDADLFTLGGNSLMAIQMVNKLRKTFDLDISVRNFNEDSSMRGISAAIENQLIKESVDA